MHSKSSGTLPARRHQYGLLIKISLIRTSTVALGSNGCCYWNLEITKSCPTLFAKTGDERKFMVETENKTSFCFRTVKCTVSMLVTMVTCHASSIICANRIWSRSGSLWNTTTFDSQNLRISQLEKLKLMRN